MIHYRDASMLYAVPNGVENGKTWKFEGNHNGPGGVDRALLVVERMRGGGVTQPITIKLLPGVYCFERTLLIGAAASNITFEPFGDGKVIFSGGKKIGGFERAEFNGTPCFAAYIPEAEAGTWTFTDLYVDGLRADFTHYPESGYLHMKDGGAPETMHGSSSECFTAETEDARAIASFRALEDTFVSFNHYWIDEHTPISSVDTETGRITMTYASRGKIRPGQEYRIENVAETFGHPNEWYLDKKTGMLYYVPRNEEQTPESIDVWAPAIHKLFELRGTPETPVTNVRFRDITFACTRGDLCLPAEKTKIYAADPQAAVNKDGLLSASYAENVTFDHCTIRNYGQYGFALREGCRHIRIRDCDFYDGGAGGVVITGGVYGTPEHTRTTDCSVSDCTILHMGRRYAAACGILAMHTARCEIIHNEIGDLYYSGISCGWTWGYAKTVNHDNRIEYNHIHDIGQGMLSDMAGIYLLGAQPGTVVTYNKVHDIRSKEYGGEAIYTDEGSSDVLIENNICYNSTTSSFYQHYGAANVVRNNIFADSDEAVLSVSRPEPHLSVIFSNNIVYSRGSAMFADYPSWQPVLGDVLEDGAIVSDRNLFFCHTGETVYSESERLKTLRDAQESGMEEDSMIADPRFVDPEHNDYRLMPDSPAFSLGFRMPDLSDVGPRRNAQ